MSESEESEEPSSISSFDSDSSYDSAPRLPRTKNRRASPCTLFMKLPAEVRLVIYKFFIASFYSDLSQLDCVERHHEEWDTLDPKPAIYLQLIGTSPHCSDGYKRDENGALFRKKSGKPGRHRFHKHSPWAMSRVCRTVHAEVAPLLDAIDIADIHFEIQQFTEAEMRRWVTLPSANMTGAERVSRMRQWDIMAQGYCDKATFDKVESSGIGRRNYRTLKSDLGESAAEEMGIAGYCWRSIYVNFATVDPNTLTDFDPETGLDADDRAVVEVAYSAEYCDEGSQSCEDSVESAVLNAWDTFDRNAWMQDGQPPVTGDLLVSLFKALSVPAPSLDVARLKSACKRHNEAFGWR